MGLQIKMVLDRQVDSINFIDGFQIQEPTIIRRQVCVGEREFEVALLLLRAENKEHVDPSSTLSLQ